MRHNDAELDIDDEVSVALSLASFKKIDSLMPKSGDEKGATSMAGALAWLRTKTNVDDATVNSFKKIDDVLQKTGLGNTVAESGFSGALDWLRQRQAAKASGMDDESASVPGAKAFTGLKLKTDEQKRAEEMASALDWLKNNDNADALDDDSLGLGSLGSFKAIDASGKDSGDGKNALDWLRKQTAGQVNVHPVVQGQDDESVGAPSFGIRPKSAEEKRANEMSDALAWLRKNEAATADDIDDVGSYRGMSQGFATPSSAGVVDGKELDNAMAWLRSKDVSSLEDDDDFTTLSGAKFVPKSKEQLKASQMKKALAFLRSKGADFDGEDTPDFNNHGIGEEFKLLSAESSSNELENALAWLRGKRQGDEVDEKFAKLDKVLPKKANQGPEERAKEMEDALAWLRLQGLGLDDEDTPLESFDTIGILPIGMRSQEERDTDRSKALNWLRNKDGGLEDYPTSGFAELDSFIPKREGQEAEDRANEMANALVWLRLNGVAIGDDGDFPSFNEVGGVSVAPRTQEEREVERIRALNWLRNKGEGMDAADDIFVKLEKFVGKAAPGQTEIERAQQMADALNWLREKGVDIDDITDPEDDMFLPVEGHSIDRRPMGSDEAAALAWLRNKNTVSDDTLFDPTGVFKKLDTSLPKKDGQSPEDRAKDMEKALAWMRGKGLVADDAELGIPDFENAGFVTVATKRPEEITKVMQDSLNWLRNKKEHGNEDDSSLFSKLDSMLPSRSGQSPEDRAAEMSEALNWLRSKGMLPDGVDQKDIDFNRAPVSSLGGRSPEQHARDLESILQWMRKGKGKGQKKEDKYDATGEFRRLDALLPKKMSQTPEQRAKEIESHLDWLRNGGDASIPEGLSFEKTDLVTVGRRTPEEVTRDYGDALNWIRSKGMNDGTLDPNGEFRRLDGLMPMKRGQSPEDRAREMSDALDWLRGQALNPSFDDESPADIIKVAVLPVCKRSPETRARDLDEALNWMRQKKSDAFDTVNGDFKKIDRLLPRRKGEDPSDRARSIESVMDWCRNMGVDPEDSLVASQFDKAGQAPFSRRTPEQRARDLADTMNWIRNKGKDDKTSDPTGDFRKLDALLPRSAGQSPEDRSRQIESCLDWIRNSEPTMGRDDNQPSRETIGSLPIARRTPEQRIGDLENALNFLRSKGTKDEKTFDPTGEFKKLDKILPRKKRGTIEDRARDIETAL